MGTHPKLSSQALRTILANELRIWRKLDRRGFIVSADTKTGFITALYRMQHVEGSEK